MLDRRQFLKNALAAGAILALPRIGQADERTAPAGCKTLVLLHLIGGNDGLNTVIPHDNPRYRFLRPTLGIEARTIIDLGQGLGFHPALRPLAGQIEAGRLAVVNGVGYPSPSYSHFRATEIWQTAEPESTPTVGWIGRALQAGASSAPVRAIALASEQPLAFAGAGSGVLTMTDFSRMRLPAGMEGVAKLYETYRDLDGPRGAVGDAGTDALEIAGRIARLRPSGGAYTGRLGTELRKVVALLQADLDLEAIHLGLGGFDTHANQAGTHNALLTSVATNLDIFQKHVAELGIEDSVVTLVYSEFGRRPEENASGGTDHGSASPMFVLGSSVKAGFHGSHPDLDELDGGNLRFTVDFRRVYAAVLAHALRLDPARILGDFTPLELFS